MKRKNFDFSAYLILFLVLLFGAGAFLFLPPLPGKKEGVVVGLSLWYFVWSLWYQKKKDYLDIKIVLEYLLVAVLGAVLLLALI
ncbi:MAG: hypothetical protein PHR64_02910 [Candidatus Shapirobacteria bacterium]|nr:hypothetical protein [Candidatus Shapirobacteria bacterium]MDD5074114.1 hypothetical protein [Candidatus Shapirobacteria bacterium]MDD5481873.1 hypothetical protein [Candidatus Shapirobacteria bacterium]